MKTDAMRVLFFSRSFTTHDRRFLEKLSGSEHEIYFLTLEDIKKNQLSQLPERVHLVCKNGLKGQFPDASEPHKLFPVLQTVIEEIGPDLIHAGPVQSCGYLTKLTEFHPYFVMSWGSDLLLEAESSDYMREITKLTLQHADVLVCDSNAVRQKALHYAEFADDEVVQFPWGVDLEDFQPSTPRSEFRKQFGWPKNALIVISARAWEDPYDPWTGIQAFSLAYLQNPKLRLILLGGGSKADEIRKVIQQERLSNVVHLAGQVQERELPDFYQSADCYLSSCPNDGTSISLLQAMTVGLPAVIANAGGNPEWVSSGRNGWLNEAGHAAAFAQSLLRAADLSVSERADISIYSRELIANKADWNKNFPKLLECYKKFMVTKP